VCVCVCVCVWHIKFRRRRITQKKAYTIQNVAKVGNKELRKIIFHLFFIHTTSSLSTYFVTSTLISVSEFFRTECYVPLQYLTRVVYSGPDRLLWFNHSYQ
jgi:hypothetical protein